MCVGLFYILLVSVSLFSTSAFNLSNTKLRISFTSNYLSSHIVVSLSRMKALLLKRMLCKNRFLITFITSILKKKNHLFIVAGVGIIVLLQFADVVLHYKNVCLNAAFTR